LFLEHATDGSLPDEIKRWGCDEPVDHASDKRVPQFYGLSIEGPLETLL
jgi:hypothetical protein